MNKNAFGKSLKEFRNKKNITQEELADKIHVSQQAISKWENGLAYPDFEILEQVCKELDISEYDLFDQTRMLEAEEEKKKIATTVIGGILGIGVIVLIFVLVSAISSKKAASHKKDNIPASQVEQVTTEPTLDDKTPEEGVLYGVEGYNRSSNMFINDGSHDDENVYVKATTAEQDYYYIRNIYEYPDGYSLVSGEKNWASFVNKTVNKLRINYLVDEKIAFWVELERDADSNIKVNSSMIEARSEQEQAASVIPKVDRISYVYKAGKYIYYLTNEKCNFNYIEKDEKIFSHTLPYITLFSIS